MSVAAQGKLFTARDRELIGTARDRIEGPAQRWQSDATSLGAISLPVVTAEAAVALPPQRPPTCCCGESTVPSAHAPARHDPAAEVTSCAHCAPNSSVRTASGRNGNKV